MSTYNLELQEIQSAYFGHECFSIFTACCYHCPTNKELVNENITVRAETYENIMIKDTTEKSSGKPRNSLASTLRPDLEKTCYC